MFDLENLRQTIAAQGAVARIVIAGFEGSSPREVGAAMLVWADGQSGTIGGGALEWQATTRARALLGTGGQRLDHEALGPKLGQCCGGAVTLLTEIYTGANLPAPVAGLIARPANGSAMPLAVKRLLDRARAQGKQPQPGLIQGWMVEPVKQPQRPVWIWGAGHVGRAIVSVLAPLPGLAITWVDIDAARFPGTLPDGVAMLPATDPALLVAHAPKDAEHLIVTYSHALDLELCHRLLAHGFARCGLIGSRSKWARFRNRLSTLGHSPSLINSIDCPIGDPAIGKHPQMIAISVAMALLHPAKASRQENAL